MCIPFCEEAWERGHCEAAEESDEKSASEDRHGQQDEEDGRAAAVRGERPQEQESHREPGTVSSQMHLSWGVHAPGTSSF